MTKLLRFGCITLFLFGFTSLFCQKKTVTETNNYLFWHQDRPLQPSDFKGSGSRFLKHNEYCNKYNMCTMAFVGIFSTLDVPTKVSNRGKLMEKYYFVPVFEKSSSYILKKDCAGVKKQQIIYDIYEISARFARKKMKQYQDSLEGYGSATLVFKTVEADAAQFRTELVNAYTTDLYVNKNENSYDLWRERINILLTNTEKYATKDEDYLRALKKQPLSKKYTTPKQFIGDFNADERE